MLHIGVIALGVTDVDRATEFWCQALGYEVRRDGFGGWATVLTPPDGWGRRSHCSAAGSALRTTRVFIWTCMLPTPQNRPL